MRTRGGGGGGGGGKKGRALVRRAADRALASRRTESLYRAEPLERRILLAGAPAVQSINRVGPATVTTNSVSYAVAFTAPVTGVDPSDFKVVATGGGLAIAVPVAVAPQSASAYSVTVDNLQGNGVFELDLIDDDSIKDAALTPLGGVGSFNGSFQGQPTTMLQAGPRVVSINRTTVANSFTRATAVTWDVSFNVPVTGVDAADFTTALSGGATATGPTTVSGSGTLYKVTVGGVAGAGSLGLNLVDDGTIRDSAGNRLGGGSPLLRPATTFATGTGFGYVAADDVNGDGAADLVCWGRYGGSVSVLIGNGDGSFQSPRTLAGSSGVRSVVPVDVNGDGRLDLLWLDTANNTVVVLGGNGDGTFQPRRTIGVPAVSSLMTADVNGDGKPDLILDNGKLIIFLGNGDATFRSLGTVASTPGGFPIVSDFDADGKLDVIAGTTFPVAEFLRGNGDGSFGSPKTFNAGTPVVWGTVADFNADEKPDVLIGNYGSLTLLAGNGNGTFATPTPVGENIQAQNPSVTDLDADGKLDVVFPDYPFGVNWISGNGDGTFAYGTGSPYGFARYAIATADLNGDGRTDLAMNGGSGAAFVSLANAAFKGQTYVLNAQLQVVAIKRTSSSQQTNASLVSFHVSFSDPVSGVDSTDFAVATSGSIVAAAPMVTGNGSDYTVSVAVRGSGRVQLNLLDDDSVIATGSGSQLGGVGTRNGSFQGQSYDVLQTYPSVASITRNDPATAGTGATSVGFTVTFSEAVTGVTASAFQVARTGTITNAVAPVVTPLNAATYQVIVAGISGTGTLGLNLVDGGSIRNLTGNALQLDVTSRNLGQNAIHIPLGTSPNATEVADLDRDGNSDLLVAEQTDLAVLLGNGNGTFRARRTFSTGGLPVDFIRVADLNGDGAPDVTVSGRVFTQVGVLMNNGDGTLQPYRVVSASYSPVCPAVADMNHDGRPDLIFTESSGSNASFLPGNGDGTFGPAQTFFIGVTEYSLEVADVNGDGNPDVVASAGTFGIRIVPGNGNGTFQPSRLVRAATDDRSVVVADFNGDGVLDLAQGDDTLGGRTLVVLLGNGDGTYRPGPAVVPSVRAIDLSAADFDGDGKVDLAFMYPSAATANILHGNGDGSFGPPTAAQLESSPHVTYYTLSIADVNGDGRPDVVAPGRDTNRITILTGTATKTFTGPTYTYVPVATSLTRFSPPDANTSAPALTFAVSFSEPVTGVDPSDFQLARTGALAASGPVTVTAVSGSVYNVTVSGVHGNGTIALNLIDNDSIVSAASGAALGGAGVGNGAVAGPSYTVAQVPPRVVSISRLTPTGPSTAERSVTYVVTFSAPVVGVDPTDFTLSLTGGVTVQRPLGVTGSGAAYFVTVNGISGTGTLGLNLADDRSIHDVPGNLLVSASGTAFFNDQVVLGTGSVSGSLATTDVNGDGRTDVITTNFDGQSVSVMLGNGNGTFQGQRTSPIGGVGSAYYAAAGDIDGDGKIDLVVSRTFTGISVLPGNGDGTFGSPSTLDAGSPTFVLLSDVNGDGRLDLLAANSGNVNYLGVYLGNGNGSFGPQRTFDTATLPGQFVLADFDRDGRPDLLIGGSSAQGTISLLRGNGDGTFKPHQEFFIGIEPRSVAAADVNGDGILDAIAGNYRSKTVSVLLGNGNGTFSVRRVFDTGPYPQNVAVQDVSGDGIPDLIATEFGANKIDVLVGNGNGTFRPRQTFAVGVNPISLAVGDLNGDRWIDVAVVNQRDRNISILFGAGPGSLAGEVYTIGPRVVSINRVSPATFVTFAVNFSAPVTGVDSTDFKVVSSGGAVGGPVAVVPAPGTGGAGYYVTLAGARGTGTIELDLIDDDSIRDAAQTPLGGAGVSNGSFAGPSVQLMPVFPYVASMVRASPATAATSSTSVSYTLTFSVPVTGVDAGDFRVVTTGDVTAATPVSVTPAPGGSVYTVSVGGISGNGTLEIDLLDNGSVRDAAGNPLVHAGQMPGFMPAPASTPPVPPPQVRATADVDADGNPDLIAVNASGTGVFVRRGRGDGTFGPSLVSTAGAGVYNAVPFDVNGDGRLDLLVPSLAYQAGVGIGKVAVMFGNGDGTFQSPRTVIPDTPAQGSLEAVADLNRDGRLDLVVVKAGQFVGTMLGNGDGTFAPATTVATTLYYTGVLSDLNSDGFPDLVLTGSDGSGNGISVMNGRSDGTFAGPHFVATAYAVSAIRAFDLNADGNADLFYSTSAYQSPFVLLAGAGNGTFRSATTFGPVGSQVSDLFDWNGDGKPDLTVPGYPILTVAPGNGDGTFGAPLTFGDAQRSNADSVADFNADGRPDVLLIYGGYNTDYRVLLNAATGGTAGPVYEIQHPRPQLLSLTDNVPPTGAATTSATTLAYLVTFSAPVFGLDPTDFKVVTAGSVLANPLVTVSPAPGASTYTVTISGIHGSGSVGLTFIDNGSVHDAAGQPLANVGPGVSFSPIQNVNPRADGIYKVVDLNADGKPDLISYYIGGQSTSVQLGNGDGSFAPATTIVTGGVSVWDVADFNNDSRPDLLVTGTGVNAFAIMFGNGNGTFAGPVATGAIFSSLQSVITADLNHDGRADLVYVDDPSFNARTECVALGNGNGTFRPRTTHAYSGGIRACADFNGDGRPDLLTSSYSQMVVEPGRGDGTFDPPLATSPPGGGLSIPLIVADLNSDGIADVVTDVDYQLAAMLGNGDGTFRPPVRVFDSVNVFAVADLDGDAKPDLLIYPSGYYHGLYVFRGNGDGTFRPASTFLVGTFIQSFTLADVNADHKPDIVLTYGGYGHGATGVMLNGRGSGANAPTYNVRQTYPHVVSIAPPAPLPPGGTAGSVVFTVTFSEPVTGVDPSDFRVVTAGGVTASGAVLVTPTGPSSVDVTVGGIAGAGTLQLDLVDDGTVRNAAGNPLLASGAGLFALPTSVATYSLRNLVPGDFTGDGITDLLAGGGGSALYLLAGNGDGSFQPVRNLAINADDAYVVADFNADGILDLFTAFPSEVLLGNGDGTFRVAQTFYWFHGADTAAADVNGDGVPDLIVAGYSAPNFSVFLGAGDGTFLSPLTFNANNAPRHIAVADLNGDGRPDIATSASSGTTMGVLAGNGDGTFADQQTFFVDAGVFAAGVADVNADGFVDLVTLRPSSLGVLLGNGNGSFRPLKTTVAPQASSLALADVNGDGRPDAVLGGFALSGTVGVLFGNGDGSFLSALKYQVGSFEEFAGVADVTGDGRPDLLIGGDTVNHTPVVIGLPGSVASPVTTVGSLPAAATVNGTAGNDVITFVRDADGAHVDWTSGTTSGQVLVTDPAGLTVNGNGGNDVITLDYTNGNPLPGLIHLNGTFTIRGLAGTNPMAGTTLDIGRSTVYFPYPTATDDPTAALRDYLRTGYATGAWSGVAAGGAGAITSSAAAANPLHNTVVAWIDAPYITSHGVPANTLMLAYALAGDTDLDGTVGLSDYAAVVRNFGKFASWLNADVTYDGTVGLDDYATVVRNFGSTLPAAAPAAASGATVNTATTATAASAFSAATTPSVAEDMAQSSRVPKRNGTTPMVANTPVPQDRPTGKKTHPPTRKRLTPNPQAPPTPG